MGYGSWTTTAYTNYSVTTKSAASINLSTGELYDHVTLDQLYTAKGMKDEMNPYGVIRECVDSEDHPNTLPIILALDVTGSMGRTAEECSRKLNTICTGIFEENKDAEIMVMGIGDFDYDHAPLQVGQFEADVRIAKWLDYIWMEHGGGGNSFESYTAAWLFSVDHCKLDCWKRGQKGIIITMGDEPMNPYIPYKKWNKAVGDTLQADVETRDLFNRVIEKYDVYHIAVADHNSYEWHKDQIANTFGQLLGDHLVISSVNALPTTIKNIIAGNNTSTSTTGMNEISW